MLGTCCWVFYLVLLGIETIFFLYLYRDRLTKDDCIGTVHLPLSQISGQGGDGTVIVVFPEILV